LITPLILGFVMVISSSRGFNVNQGLEKLPFSGLPIYTNITFTLFVGWMLMFNLSTTSISREGKNYWLLNAAPVKPGHLLWAKYIVSLLPTLAIGCFFVAITAVIRSIQLIDIVYILLVASLCFAGLNGILLAFGVAGSNLTWEDPRKISLQGKAGCLSLLTCLGYFGICVLLFLGPPVLWELINIGNVVIGRMIGLVLGAVFSILCAILPPVAIRERVPMIGQPKD
jgi:ABC-2 type transport system permease protein